MFIELLLVLLIIGLLVAGPSFDNILVAVAVYGGIIVGIILAWWYSGRLSSGIAGFLLGGSGGNVKETYSLAERYEIEHKYRAAIELYRKAIETDKRNPAPRIRLADLFYKLRDYDSCVKYMQEALHVSRNMSEDQRCALMNRIADVYLQHKQDPASAVAVLRTIVKNFPNSKYAFYARERIVQIKESG